MIQPPKPTTGYISVTRSSNLAVIDLLSSLRSRLQRVLGGSRDDSPSVRGALLGHRGLYWPLPPSTSPEDPRFKPRSYWRGPTWPVVNWLFWWSLLRVGEHERAEELRRTALDQLAVRGFGEYFDPFTGQLLGSADQSWTAAVALDWLAHDPAPEENLPS